MLSPAEKGPETSALVKSKQRVADHGGAVAVGPGAIGVGHDRHLGLLQTVGHRAVGGRDADDRAAG